jgi:PIN domain nuclease of toxin-antitoxin system
MRLLLDTHVLLWMLHNRLDAATRATMAEPGTEVLFSAASIWEIAIKSALRRLDFTYRPDAVAKAARMSGLVELPLHAGAAARVADLPFHHRDPFDRLLVAQALAESARLLTADPLVARYSDLVTLIRPLPTRA